MKTDSAILHTEFRRKYLVMKYNISLVTGQAFIIPVKCLEKISDRFSGQMFTNSLEKPSPTGLA